MSFHYDSGLSAGGAGAAPFAPRHAGPAHLGGPSAFSGGVFGATSPSEYDVRPDITPTTAPAARGRRSTLLAPDSDDEEEDEIQHAHITEAPAAQPAPQPAVYNSMIGLHSSPLEAEAARITVNNSQHQQATAAAAAAVVRPALPTTAAPTFTFGAAVAVRPVAPVLAAAVPAPTIAASQSFPPAMGGFAGVKRTATQAALDAPPPAAAAALQLAAAPLTMPRGVQINHASMFSATSGGAGGSSSWSSAGAGVSAGGGGGRAGPSAAPAPAPPPPALSMMRAAAMAAPSHRGLAASPPALATSPLQKRPLQSQSQRYVDPLQWYQQRPHTVGVAPRYPWQYSGPWLQLCCDLRVWPELWQTPLYDLVPDPASGQALRQPVPLSTTTGTYDTDMLFVCRSWNILSLREPLLRFEDDDPEVHAAAVARNPGLTAAERAAATRTVAVSEFTLPIHRAHRLATVRHVPQLALYITTVHGVSGGYLPVYFLDPSVPVRTGGRAADGSGAGTQGEAPASDGEEPTPLAGLLTRDAVEAYGADIAVGAVLLVRDVSVGAFPYPRGHEPPAAAAHKPAQMLLLQAKHVIRIYPASCPDPRSGQVEPVPWEDDSSAAAAAAAASASAMDRMTDGGQLY